MENKECEACKMLTLCDGLSVCPLCLWEQDSTPNIVTSHKTNE